MKSVKRFGASLSQLYLDQIQLKCLKWKFSSFIPPHRSPKRKIKEELRKLKMEENLAESDQIELIHVRHHIGNQTNRETT